MNLLDLVPTFSRQLGLYQNASHTDSTLAAYLADAVDALNSRWTRDYVIEYTSPNTYYVTPDIEPKDKHIVVLAASIIYKGAYVELASIRDGDFAYDPQQGRINPISADILELDKLLPIGKKLAQASTAPLRGFSGIFNPESYLYMWPYNI